MQLRVGRGGRNWVSSKQPAGMVATQSASSTSATAKGTALPSPSIMSPKDNDVVERGSMRYLLITGMVMVVRQ